MSREREERALSTADLVSATEESQVREETKEREAMPEAMRDERETSIEEQRMMESRPAADVPQPSAMKPEGEPLAALFDPDLCHDYRTRWSNVQIGFVDDPKRAVQQADELVAQVMKSLAESFARQRAEIEARMGEGEQGSTENMRVALRRYRSFFERLLSL